MRQKLFNLTEGQKKTAVGGQMTAHGIAASVAILSLQNPATKLGFVASQRF